MGRLVMSDTEIIQRALHGAISYTDYRKEVDKVAALGTPEHAHLPKDLLVYTQMNAHRMKRWDRVLGKSEGMLMEDALREPLVWLVLSEVWCGDAAHSLPVMNQIAGSVPGLDLKIVMRDTHPELMDLFLTHGTRSIPILIQIRPETGEVLAQWGPRPAEATALVAAEKERHGTLSSAFKQELQMWYNKDKGRAIRQELIALLPLE